MRGPASAAVIPSWTWGSSAKIIMLNDPVQSVQLAEINLPEPAVCSIYLQAAIVSNFDPLDTVQAFTVNLIEGVGRVAVPRQMSFIGQPAVGAPLEVTIPFIPLHALQVNIEAVGLFFSGTPRIEIETYLVLSPLTRIQQPDGQRLDFGMATPGEADSMDDELRGNLEDESPSVQAIMEQERLNGEGETAPPIDVEGEEVTGAPAWILDLVDALTERLGRPPTRRQLALAVARLRARQQRRAHRG